MATPIDPETGEMYIYCHACGVDIEDSGLRSHNVKDHCIDCVGDDSAMVFDEPHHAWGMAMKYLKAYVRSLPSVDGYEFDGPEDDPQLRIFDGDMEEALSDFTDVMRDALEQRAQELGL